MRKAVFCVLLLVLAVALIGARIRKDSNVNKFGIASAVSLDGSIIWVGHDVVGANLFPASAGALTVVSSSASDSDGGGGTETVELEGIYLNGCDIDRPVTRIVTATLTGITPVDPDPGQADCWFRVFRAKASTGGDNVGRIDISIGAEIVSIIDPGIGQTEQAATTVLRRVAVDRLLVEQLPGGGQTPAMVMKLFSRPWGGPRRVRVVPLAVTEGNPSAQIIFPRGVSIEARSDIWVEAFDVVSGNATLTASFSYASF